MMMLFNTDKNKTCHIRVNFEYEVICGNILDLSMDAIFSSPQGNIDVHLLNSNIEIIDAHTDKEVTA